MRAISTTFRNAIEAVSSSEVALVFLTITHDDLDEPIRLVSEDENGVSYYNGEIINYNLDGYLYYGCPFSLALLTDDERPPRGQLSFVDPEREFGLAILSIVDSPRIRFDVFKLSDFVEGTYDSNNARSPSGSSVAEYVADYLFLKNVSSDGMIVQADVASYDLVGEPWPKLRSTHNRMPALFR